MANKVVFIGSNPSVRSSSIVPFWNDTRSASVLNNWISQLGLSPDATFFMNVTHVTTPNNRPLKKSEIVQNLDSLRKAIEVDVVPDKIVTLGKTAALALTLLGISHYEMPHPSGLNRQLNDPKFVEEKINGLRDYLNPSKIE